MRHGLHNFLLVSGRNFYELEEHAKEFESIVSFAVAVPWRHTILFEQGLDIFLGYAYLRLTLTRKGYRVLGCELDFSPKSLAIIMKFLGSHAS